jgi:hypothetical protein
MTMFSVEMVLENGAGQARYATAFSRTVGETWTNGEGLYFESVDGTLRLWVGKYNVAPTVMPFPVGSKAHIVGTFDGTTARLYKDGQQVATSKPTAISSTGQVMWSGAPGGYAWAPAPTGTFYYERALTAAEVADRYAASQAPPPPPPPPPPSRPAFLSPDSQWRRPLGNVSGEDVFYDGQTADLCAYVYKQIAKERAANRGPWVATYNSSSYVWVADANTPRRKVLVRPALSAAWRKPLQKVFDNFPIPDGAYTTTGEDAVLTVYEKDADELYEAYWFHQPSEYGGQQGEFASCHWGGATKNASKSGGVYNIDSWPPWSRPNWGATAGSHYFAAGLITMDELLAGEINHALAVDFGKMRAGIVHHPAFRTDGLNFDQYSVAYGARFRLAPEINLDAVTFATPLAKMIAKALQKHGMIARNQTGGAFTIFCEDPSPAGMRGMFWDQQTGAPAPNGFFKGMQPYQALDGIPWESLLLIEAWPQQTPATTMGVRGDFSDTWKAQTLERLVGKNPAATRYLALFTTAPRHDTANVPGVEISGPGYARPATTAADWRTAFAYQSGLNMAISNAAAKSFPAPLGSWGAPEAVAVMDAPTGGNMLAFGWLPASLRNAPAVGRAFSIPVDGIWLQDMAVSVYSGLGGG